MTRAVYNQLSTRRIASLTAPGRYTDGLGLMLVIDKKGNRRWILRVTERGRRRDYGLGSAKEVSLKEAREYRDAIRQRIRRAQHFPEAGAGLGVGKTFESFAIELHGNLKVHWKNKKHAEQWIRTLQTYAFPRLGKLRLADVNALVIKEALQPIWSVKPETARRVKQRIARVISAAIAEGLRDGPNPALDATAGLGSAKPKPKHFAAMPYVEVPGFIRRLRRSDMGASSRLGFEFLILTATRTSEVLNARWTELDRDNDVWTIPAERMKTNQPHTVPLTPQMLEVLDEAQIQARGSRYVFPGKSESAPLSNMVFIQALKRFGEPFTAHGFRSSFRDWAEEQTSYSHAVKEAALAHTTKSKVEAAYRRSTLVEQRRTLMDDWCLFCGGGRNEPTTTQG